MIEFSLPYALAVIFLSAFLPGMLASLGILKKSDFSILEKLLTGAALGVILQGFLPLAEFTFAGIMFSPLLALLNTGLMYSIGIGLFLYFRAHEGLALPDLKKMKEDPLAYAVPAFVILVFLLNFFVRIQTLSPIFQELDPYYYMYTAQQIITDGYNPFDDQTAWYPEEKVGHKGAPLKAYMEATGYSLYYWGRPYDNYILSYFANVNPPFAAAFAAFFLYLGLRAWFRSEYALIGSAVASFIPIFIMKLAAGEAEVQPYAFFGLSLFLAFFLWAHRKQDFKYMVLAGIGYFATSLGSSSEVVAATFFLIFTILQAASMLLARKDLENFAKLTGVLVAFALITSLMKSLFMGYPVVSYAAAVAAAGAFAAALYAIQKYLKSDSEMQLYSLGGLALLGIALIAFTPVGGLLKSVALSGLQIAEYTLPLHRTIAEQGTSGSVFEPSLGFMGKIFDHGIYVGIGYLAAIPSAISNLVFGMFAALINAVVGTNLQYTDKDNSVMMALFFFFFLSLAYGLYRKFGRGEETAAWLLVALVMPIALVGLIKAKYIIYLGFVLSAALAFVLAELELLLTEAATYLKMGEDVKKYVLYALLAVGMLFAFMQFVDSGAPAIAKAGFATRFQDDPAALQQKFSELCDQLRLQGQDDADICAAGKDAVAYANVSVNSQYNYKLCLLSLLKDPFDQNEDRTGAAYRCERISDYWIDSMEWIRYHTENGSRITSWWDYGHWENFFGQRNAVIRNEHVSPNMIGKIADDYILGTPEELKYDMLRYNSTYALFDAELLFSGNSFGGKYGALNYLGCAFNNYTNVSRSPGSSVCEFEHLWTQVYVPASPTSQDYCDISYSQKGVFVYSLKPVETQGGLSYDFEQKYCLGQTTLADGQNTSALYELDRRSADGTLKLHKAFLKSDYTTQDGRWKVYTLIYAHDLVWVENGTVTDGWADRTGKFYDSNLYNAFVLESLPGFDLVYKTPDGMVKIFKIK